MKQKLLLSTPVPLPKTWLCGWLWPVLGIEGTCLSYFCVHAMEYLTPAMGGKVHFGSQGQWAQSTVLGEGVVEQRTSHRGPEDSIKGNANPYPVSSLPTPFSA